MPVWFEAGRREIFRILTPDLNFANWRVILVNTNIDFTDQIYFEHEAEVLTWVEHVGGKSFRLYEEVHQTGRICARGSATYVYFNYQTQQAETVPVEARRAFTQHMRASGDTALA